MRGISLEQRWGKIERDVAIVEKNAIGTIVFAPDSQSFKLVRNNESPRLGVLAIIGPAQGFKKEFDKALLAEIGIGPTYPYHESFGLNHQPGQSHIPYRRKWFDLTTQQYCLIAPAVFEFIIQTAQEKVDNWENPDFTLKVLTKRRWSHKHKKIFEKEEWLPVPKGARFSIAREDQFFLQDIFWAELNLNQILAHKFEGIARFIDKRTDFYRIYQVYKWKRPFEKMTVRKDIEDSIRGTRKSPFPLYFKEEIVKRLPRGEKTMFYWEIKKLFGLLSDSQTLEQSLAKEAENLPTPERRLGNIHLRLTTGFDKNKDYIVFEVIPPVQKDKDVWEKNPTNLPEESLDDIPF